MPGHLRALLSVQDRAGQGSAFSGGDGASAAPVGPGLDAGTRESGTMLEGPEAVKEGLIDEVGGIREALGKLYELIEMQKKE